MGFKELWNEVTNPQTLDEKLDKQFYSDKEAMLDRNKNSTQIVTPSDIEDTSIYYDPFSGYSNHMIQNSLGAAASYNDMVRKWREISNLPEVDKALLEITSEAVVFDEIDNVVSLNLDELEIPETIKAKITSSFDKILYLLDFNEKGEELFRQWYVDASLNFEVVYNNRNQKDGIQKLCLLAPYNIYKFKNENSSEIRWYINSKTSYNPAKDIEDAEKTYYDEQFCQITSGKLSADKKFYQSHLQKAMKAINQLYLLEDTLIIARITKSTEKRIFYIDTGNLPKAKAEEYIRNLIQKYRQKKVYNTELGTIENKNKSISVLEDFWFPVTAAGKGTRVENLQGISTNFSGFDDVNYFSEKVWESLNVPLTRRNKEAKVDIASNISIERDEMNFYKFILMLRRRFNNLFVDLLKKDLLAKQVMKLQDWNKIQEKIKFKYASSNDISLFKKMQINQVKMDAAGAALTLLDSGILSKRYIQSKILGLTDEEIQEIESESGAPAGAGTDALGNMAGGSMPAGSTPPGYEEVGGAPAPEGGAEGEAPVEEPPAEEEKPKKRFQQKAREGKKNDDIMKLLREGDILTDGERKLIFKNGKLEKYES